jgi:hypothetical protein
VPDLPPYVVPVIVNDQIRLRIYQSRDLKLELPLRRRQALVLASQLLNHALMAEGRLDGGALVLETPDQQRVAKRAEGCTHDE